MCGFPINFAATKSQRKDGPFSCLWTYLFLFPSLSCLRLFVKLTWVTLQCLWYSPSLYGCANRSDAAKSRGTRVGLERPLLVCGWIGRSLRFLSCGWDDYSARASGYLERGPKVLGGFTVLQLCADSAQTRRPSSSSTPIELGRSWKLNSRVEAGESGSRPQFILQLQSPPQLHWQIPTYNWWISMFLAFTVDDPNSSFNSARVGPEFGLEFRRSWRQVGQPWNTLLFICLETNPSYTTRFLIEESRKLIVTAPGASPGSLAVIRRSVRVK